MNENSTQVKTDGDVLGVAGTNAGTVNITYISQTNSETEIQARKLIEGSPYLGLEKFGVDDKDKFFGRDRWIIELTNYLAKENILLLLGASGSGKSSLIQAGLIPKLKDQWGSQLFNFTFVPDVDPFESFYGCLLTKYKQSDAKIARTVQEDTLIKVVESLKKENIQWLIFIDQFEELFTRTPQKERDIFVKSLIRLIDKNDPTVKVVMTMRADFLDKLGPYPALGKIHDYQSRMLTDMEDGDLRLAIAEPAARNGVTFEAGLIDQIIADFHQQAGSLPLLQYTLNLLWKNDDINDRVLNSETYQKLGGVTGALQQQADKIYGELEESERKAAEQIFLELIVLEGKEPVSRRADQSSFKEGTIEAKVLSELIDNRLLVSKGEGGKATVEVAHEALLRSWPVLQNLIREKEEIIVLKNRLYADARNWQDAQKASSELWSGSKLTRIVELKKEQALPNLDGVANEFIEASAAERDRQQKAELERQKRDKRTAQRIAGGSLVAVLVSSSSGLVAWQKTQQAELNQAESLGRESLALLNENRRLEAGIQAIKAGKILRAQNTTNPEVIKALQEALAHQTEQNRLIGHQDAVSSVALSSDSKTLVSGSVDKTIKVWNLATGGEPRTLNGHQDLVSSVALSSDGKALVSGSYDNTIKVWDLATGKELRTLNGHQEPVNSVALSSDGKTLVSGSYDKTIKVWDLATGKELRTLNGHQDLVSSVALSSDGKTLVSGSGDKTIKVWDLATGKELRTLNGHQDLVSSVALSSDGKTLVSGSGDKTIKVWDLATGKELRTLNGHQDWVRIVALSSDGKTLVSGSVDKIIKVWDLATGKELRTLNGHQNAVWSVTLSSDGKTLVSGSYDKTIKVWDLATGKELRTLNGHQDAVLSVALSSNGKALVSGSGDKTIKVWDLATGGEPRTLNNQSAVNSVALSSDGQTLISGSYDKTIKVWDLATGKEPRTLNGHQDAVLSVALSSNGKALVSGSGDKTIKVWDLATGKEPRTLNGHQDAVLSVALSSDGKTLVSGSWDKTIKVWDLATGGEPRTLNGHQNAVLSVALSSDGKTLVSGSYDKTIKVWDLATGKELRTLNGHQERVNSVALSRDGKTLVSGSWDKTIKVWDLATGKEPRTLNGHQDSVSSVALSSDGKTLVSGSWDKTIKVWDLDLDSLMAKSCNWVRAYLQNPNSDVDPEDRKLCDGIGNF